MKSMKIALCVAVCALFAACTTGPKQTVGALTGALAGGALGSQVGDGKGKTVATVAGALLGAALGGEVGRQLDDRDRLLMGQAEYTALETGKTGTTIPWQNPDNGHTGSVTPGPSYQVNNNQCRDFTHTVYIGGQPETARGTACRQADGTWRIAS